MSYIGGEGEIAGGKEDRKSYNQQEKLTKEELYGEKMGGRYCRE